MLVFIWTNGRRSHYSGCSSNFSLLLEAASPANLSEANGTLVQRRMKTLSGGLSTFEPVRVEEEGDQGLRSCSRSHTCGSEQRSLRVCSGLLMFFSSSSHLPI